MINRIRITNLNLIFKHTPEINMIKNQDDIIVSTIYLMFFYPHDILSSFLNMTAQSFNVAIWPFMDLLITKRESLHLQI